MLKWEETESGLRVSGLESIRNEAAEIVQAQDSNKKIVTVSTLATMPRPAI